MSRSAPSWPVFLGSRRIDGAHGIQAAAHCERLALGRGTILQRGNPSAVSSGVPHSSTMVEIAAST